MTDEDLDKPEVKEKRIPYEKWRDDFKAKWKQKQKEVIFENENGDIITPTTTTTTTTTPKPTTTPTKNVTTAYPTFIVTGVTTPSEGGRTDKVAAAETTQLIKVVGITCASLIGVILLAVLIIRMCRKSSAKKRQRLTVRRPLTENEREEHIYAEIEPLQRTPSPGGASGTSSDVQLPKRKTHKRRKGISSFRALSTRIYRFFNVDTDDQSVFYNRSAHEVEHQAPEPPERNIANGRKSNKPVRRGESTASRRPLLDGDSRASTSSGAEMRSNIYNPLIRENEVRASGPYDHLTLSKTPSGNIVDNTPEPSSPHDYFTLEKTAGSENTNNSDGAGDGPHDTVVVKNEMGSGVIETIEEEAEPSETPKNHDYFVLEPHEREGVNKESPSKASVKSNHSVSKSNSSKNGSPVKDGKPKPDVTPRVTTKSSSSPDKVIDDTDNTSKVEDVKRSESKEETYVLAKLGDAPEPPDAQNDDEYLSPSDVQKHPDYIDVLPNPPPRSTSLQPHEMSGNSSPVLEKKSPEIISRSDNNSPTPINRNGSTTPKSSPTKTSTKSSPSKSPIKTSPQKSSLNKSPTKTPHTPVTPTQSKTETTL